MANTDTNRRRTLVLTGASRGIGHATVKRFSSAGWRVITCSRMAFPEDCPWEAGPEDHVRIDLADVADTERGVEEIRSRLDDGMLNALVNNAGISPKGPEGERLSSLNTEVATWQQVFQVNFMAPVMLARGLAAELEAGQGSIVNVTSIVGSQVHPFAGTAYATSKAALASLTREMAARTSAPSASASTPSRPARSRPRSSRPTPRRSWRPRCRCAASALPRKWPR